jgi:outer membrane protein
MRSQNQGCAVCSTEHGVATISTRAEATPRSAKSRWLTGLILLTTLSSNGGVAAEADDSEIALPHAVQRALDANLDLLAQRHSLDAAREEIGLARSSLLPQLGVGARAQILDDDRSDGTGGSNDSESVLLGAELEQILYDEESWAGFQIRKFEFDSQMRGFETFELGVIQETANAYAALDRARRILAIEERNRELTRANRETSSARIAAGWSSDREILRWDVQLAANDADVTAARVDAMQSLFEFNRVQNLPPENSASIRKATLQEHGFVFSRPQIASIVATPDGARRMRDFFVRMGLQRSPDLMALTSAIRGSERQLTANRRAFWVPTFKLVGSVEHLASESDQDDVTATEWTAKAVATFPLFQGGAKFSGLAQAKASLASLRLTRRSFAQSLEQSIRSAVAQANGAFESVNFARRQSEAARRNFELVDASYTLGMMSILDLLDAQQQRLSADRSLVDASYGFLRDLFALERVVTFYPFLEPPDEVEALLTTLESDLVATP